MTTRPTNRRGEGDNLRRDLIRAATDLLVSPQELAAPSLRAIARECGVSPSGVYLHFASQTDLLIAVIEALYDELRQALAATDDPGAAAIRRLQAMAHTYVNWGLEHPGAYQLLFESADVMPDELGVVGPGIDLLSQVADLLSAHSGTNAQASHELALRVWASLHGLTSLRLHKPMAPWSTSAHEDATAIITSYTSRPR